MLKLPWLALLPMLALPLAAVDIGDSLDKVIAEKGAPAGRLEAGEVVILNYPGQSIRFNHRQVVSVTATSPSVPVPAAPASAPPTASSVAARHAPPSPEYATGAAAQWTTDYSAALAQAKAQDRKVFLLFTGSDWCIWCRRLEGEILSTQAFADYAGENLILVKLDFPRALPQSEALQEQNHALAEHYGIRGYPTVIVLDSSGNPVGKLGYCRGGPEPFLGELKKL
jgi:protein disulfide-isomerase